MVTIMLDQERRLKIYGEGELEQDRHLIGIGWVVADDEEWNIDLDRVAIIREASKYMFLPLAGSRRLQPLLPNPNGG